MKTLLADLVRAGGRPLNLVAALLLLGTALPLAAAPEFSKPVAINSPEQGRQVAAELRSLLPAEDSLVRGTLRIRQKDRRTVAVPFVSRVSTGGPSWRVVYETGAVPGIPAERLEVNKLFFGGNQYARAVAPDTNSPAGPVRTVTGRELETPLAGSDFYLSDLGLEFLHWPHQVLLSREMRRSCLCWVLESRPAVTNRYARIVSTIDTESKGIVEAEAFDAAGRRVKFFEVDSLKKVNGRYQVRAMEMTSYPDRTRTLMEFDLNDPPKPKP